VVSLILQ